jgi:hypothetical protein
VGFSNTRWHFFELNILRSPAGLIILLGQAKGRDAPPTDQDGTAKAITPVGYLVKFLIAVVFHYLPHDKIDKNDGGTLRKELHHGFYPLGFSSTLEYMLTMGIQRSLTMLTSFKNPCPIVAGEM